MPDCIRITLPCGRDLLIDAEDEAFVRSHKWRSQLPTRSYTRYAARHKPGASGEIFLHRELLNAPDGMMVDHLNGDGLDCRRSNIRLATASENACNRRRPSDATNPYRGVRQNGPHGRWVARIGIHGTKHYLGSFATPEEAARAYDAKALELHGEFARLNFPEGDGDGR